jgi:hypothetical protein
MSFTETIQLISGREASISTNVRRYISHFDGLSRQRYRLLLRSKKYPASKDGKIKSPNDWITWKYLSNLSVTGFSKSDSADKISFIPTPNNGEAIAIPRKKVTAKLEIMSSMANRIRVKGVRLSRMGCFGKSTVFGYFCG